jgi:hypothetical protein
MKTVRYFVPFTVNLLKILIQSVVCFKNSIPPSPSWSVDQHKQQLLKSLAENPYNTDLINLFFNNRLFFHFIEMKCMLRYSCIQLNLLYHFVVYIKIIICILPTLTFFFFFFHYSSWCCWSGGVCIYVFGLLHVVCIMLDRVKRLPNNMKTTDERGMLRNKAVREREREMDGHEHTKKIQRRQNLSPAQRNTTKESLSAH